MPANRNLSPGAALLAVVTALVVGMLASLAIRPPGDRVQSPVADSAVVAREQVRWRLASTFTIEFFKPFQMNFFVFS